MSLESLIDSDYARAVDTRLQSHDAYVDYQMREAQRAVPFLARFFPVQGARVLEVGTGRGGKGMAYAAAGMKVTALDVDVPALEQGAATARDRAISICFLVADGGQLPFCDGYFDAILFDSVIEHVADPLAVMAECRRVLKLGGIIFVVFPPYYGPLSGHIDDYVMIPWFHLLPRGVVKRFLLARPAQPGFLAPRDAYAVYASLNRLTIFQLKRIARRIDLHIEYLRVRPFLTHPGMRLVAGLLAALRHSPRRQSLRTVWARARREFDPATFLLFLLLSAIAPWVYIPILQEVAAGGCKCVLKKV